MHEKNSKMNCDWIPKSKWKIEKGGFNMADQKSKSVTDFETEIQNSK